MTHEQLLQVHRKLPEDYQPWGELDRESVNGGWGVDCSSGCKHAAWLEGKLGFDWCVCCNPKSHRVGLLTFEHQGCPQYEIDPALADDDC